MNTIAVANIIGYTGAVIGSCLMIPQLYTSWRTKRMGEISFVMLTLYLINSALWSTYGILLSAPPIYITNLIAGTVGICLIIMKIVYAKNSKNNTNKSHKSKTIIKKSRKK